MQSGDVFLIIYSIASRESFEKVERFHQQILRVKGQDQASYVLIGNKCDFEIERQVNFDGESIVTCSLQN